MTLFISAVLALFSASDASLNFLAKHFFNSEELSISSIEGTALRLNGLTLASAKITSPSYTAIIKDLSVNYDLAGLYSGMFQSIALAELNLIMNDIGTTQDAEQSEKPVAADSLENMLALVANPPFDELTVQRFNVTEPNNQIEGSLKFASNPSSISGQFSASSVPGLQLTIDSSISTNAPLSLSLRLSKDTKPIVNSEAQVTINQNDFSLTSVNEIAIKELFAALHDAALLPNLSSPTANLQITASLVVDKLLTAPRVESLDVAIDNQAGLVQLLFTQEGKPLSIEAELPLLISSSDRASQNSINLEISEINLVALGQIEGTEINSNVNANSVSLECNHIYNCELNAALTATGTNLSAQDFDIEEIEMTGDVTGLLTAGVYSLQGSNSVLSLKGARYDETTASLTSSITNWNINQPEAHGSIQDDFISLDAESIGIATRGHMAGIQFDSAINASNLNLTCQHTISCKLNTILAAKIANVKSRHWSAEEFNLTTTVEANLTNENYRVHGSDTAINIRGGAYDETTTSFDSALSQWVIEGDATQLLSAQTQFQLSNWKLGYGEFGLNEPLISGRLNLSNNELVAAIEASLQPSFKISSQLSSNLILGNGNLTFEMPQLSFNQGSPLSAYIQGIDSQFDIIAGAIAATGKLDWVTDDTGTPQYSGPIGFDVKSLSGNYNDYFFLDLTTDLVGEFASPLGMKTAGVQTARIGTAELGLPIRDITWDYEFNSANSTMAIYDLTGNLLGGQVSVPEAKFNDFSSNTELTVVISDLDLARVTALAEYPELQVQGYASGYLPIYVQSGAITMRKGLVSALNPGGSIRYRPENPSTNASVKFVNDALSNYQFKTLDSELNYDESGDLIMQVGLKGGNPDMPAGQQINVNLNIVNNVPDMLESLRASRSIEDALERALQRRP